MREQIRSGVLPRRVRTGCRRSLWLAAPVQRDLRVMAQHSKRCVPALSRDEQHRWSSRSPVGRSVRVYTALTPYLRRVRHPEPRSRYAGRYPESRTLRRSPRRASGSVITVPNALNNCGCIAVAVVTPFCRGGLRIEVN